MPVPSQTPPVPGFPMVRAGVSCALSVRPYQLEEVLSGYVLTTVRWAREEARQG